MQESLSSYVNRCFKIASGAASERDISSPILHLCSSHTMKNAKSLVTTVKHRKQEFLHIIGTLAISTSLKDLAQSVYHFTVILASKSAKTAEESWQCLKLKASLDFNMASGAEDFDFCNDPIALDHSDNLFQEHFSKVIDKALDAVSDCDVVDNLFFNPGLLSTFRKYWIPQICLWSSLMLGDLGRLGVGTGYQKYSKFYDGLSSKIEQNLTTNNRTQGIMEKSQQELKRTRLEGRRFRRLDEIAVAISQKNTAILREYGDSIKKRRRPSKVPQEEVEHWKKRSRTTVRNEGVGRYFAPPRKPLRDLSKPKAKSGFDVEVV